MNNLKKVVKIIAKLIMSGSEPSEGEEFIGHIRQCVSIAMEVSSEILSVFGVETEFKTRGITTALSEEITQELHREATE